MEWNLTTIIVLLVILFIGYGIGLLENYLKYSSKLKEAERKNQALQAAQDDAATTPVRPPEALRVWTNPEQNLTLELDGQTVESPQSINPEQRRRLINLLTLIRPWLESGPIAPASQAPERHSSLAAAVQATPPRPVIVTPPAEPSPASASKSIVAQIDDVLQKQLSGTPLASRRIFLRETPSGGVLVHIGPDHYEGINAVPDPEIQAIIRQAVARWEKSQQ